METTYTINLFKKNQISLYAVQGEENGRIIIFNIVEQSGTIAPTSNAVATDKMMDLTGFTVTLYLLNSRRVSTAGLITDAEHGIVEFMLPAEFTEEAGKFECGLSIAQVGQELRAAGISLTVEPLLISDSSGVVHADPSVYGVSSSVELVIPRATKYTLKFQPLQDINAQWLRASRRSPSRTGFVPGDMIFFGIKKHPDDEDYILSRIAVRNQQGGGGLDEYGNFTVTLSETDTDIEPGIYYYSIAADLVQNPYNTALPGLYEICPATPLRIRGMMVSKNDIYRLYEEEICEMGYIIKLGMRFDSETAPDFGDIAFDKNKDLVLTSGSEVKLRVNLTRTVCGDVFNIPVGTKAFIVDTGERLIYHDDDTWYIYHE